MFWSVLLDATEAVADTNGSGESFFAKICTNVADYMKAIGSYIVLILGVIAVCMAIWQIVKAFAAGGRGNWGITICCLLFGGILITAGWSTIFTGEKFGGFGKTTLEEMMNGSTPTAINDFNSGSSTSDDTGEGDGTEGDAPPSNAGGSASIAKARNGLGIISSGFMVPLGTALVIATGVCLVVIAIYQVGKHFITGGKGQLSIPKLAAMVILGSCMFAATPTENSEGWKWLRDVLSAATKDTVINIVDSQGAPSQSTDDFSGDITGGSNNSGDDDTVLPGANPSDIPT